MTVIALRPETTADSDGDNLWYCLQWLGRHPEMKLQRDVLLVGTLLLLFVSTVTAALAAEADAESCPAGDFPEYVLEEVRKCRSETQDIWLYLEGLQYKHFYSGKGSVFHAEVPTCVSED